MTLRPLPPYAVPRRRFETRRYGLDKKYGHPGSTRRIVLPILEESGLKARQRFLPGVFIGTESLKQGFQRI
jgi:hypothetical protein